MRRRARGRGRIVCVSQRAEKVEQMVVKNQVEESSGLKVVVAIGEADRQSRCLSRYGNEVRRGKARQGRSR